MSQQDPKNDEITRTEALFSMIVGLFAEVAPALRAASIRWGRGRIKLFFYYDGRISEEDEESARCVSTEVISDFSEHVILEDDSILRWDYPKPIPHEGELVYYRKEPISPEQRKKLISRYPSYTGLCPTYHNEELLTLNRALWGRVSPQLRLADVYWNDPKVRLVFYYDGAISEEDAQLSEGVRTEFLEYYPNYTVDLELIRLDTPTWLPKDKESRTLYFRRE